MTADAPANAQTDDDHVGRLVEANLADVKRRDQLHHSPPAGCWMVDLSLCSRSLAERSHACGDGARRGMPGTLSIENRPSLARPWNAEPASSPMSAVCQ